MPKQINSKKTFPLLAVLPS